MGATICCGLGHRLSHNKDGGISLRSLIRGDELALSVCQNCPDFDYMGDTPPLAERGWTPNAYEIELCRDGS